MIRDSISYIEKYELPLRPLITVTESFMLYNPVGDAFSLKSMTDVASE
jgi:hypothetical protein